MMVGYKINKYKPLCRPNTKCDFVCNDVNVLSIRFSLRIFKPQFGSLGSFTQGGGLNGGAPLDIVKVKLV